jgi:multiple sugar transport system substrate-binding protein
MRAIAGLVLVTVAVIAAGCGSSGSSGSAGTASTFTPGTGSIKGQTITVLLPYQVPSRLLQQFTAETGVKVNFHEIEWDALKAKLLTANSAKTYIADVTEFDWSFTGQFGGAGWDEPLEHALPASLLSNLGRSSDAFKYHGHQYAVCYSDGFYMSIFNAKMLHSAGARYPATFADFAATIAKLKAAGIQYPLTIPMAATEGGIAPWEVATLAMGGQLFDSHFNPLFATPGSAGYRALQWLVSARHNGWVSPGNITLDDVPAFAKFMAGNTAMAFNEAPGVIPLANTPANSKAAPNVRGALVPGDNGPGTTMGVPEGLAIPVTAQHKDAALAFIKWWEQDPVTMALYKAGSLPSLPCTGSAVAMLTKAGELQSGAAIQAELHHVVPLFPQGAPAWYAQFSSDAQGLFNAAYKGSMSVGSALTQLAADARKLAAGKSQIG